MHIVLGKSVLSESAEGFGEAAAKAETTAQRDARFAALTGNDGPVDTSGNDFGHWVQKPANRYTG